VVVANILIRTLKTEVEKVSMGTIIGHGLSGPKYKISFFISIAICMFAKGYQVNILDLMSRYYTVT
jgi:hypothetical protein